MRIDNIHSELAGDRGRVTAEVTWEDSERPSQRLYYETEGEVARDLEPNPDAFLLPCLPIAVWQGERRILVTGSVCARLRDGLATTMAIFREWHAHCRPLRIEPTRGFVPRVPRAERRAASFMSGGIDALALLRANRRDYPLRHPGAIQDGLLLFGLNTFDFDAAGPRPERLAAFTSHVQRMQRLADLAHLTLVPVITNTRTLYPDFHTWTVVGFTAGTVGVALALSRRLTDAWLASGGLGMGPHRVADHLMLPPSFSSAAVEIHVGQPEMTRFEKTRLVADWDEALPFLRSCLYHEIPPAGLVNCGSCEKCVRTMVALVALGKLERASSFPHRDVTPEMLEAVPMNNPWQIEFYSQCIEALERSRRHDLARLLRAKIESYHRREHWKRLARLDRFDRRFLGGRLGHWYARLR